MESNLQPPDPRERRRQRDRDRYAQMSDQKKGEVLKKRREARRQKKAAALLMFRITVHQLLFKTMKRIQSNQC